MRTCIGLPSALREVWPETNARFPLMATEVIVAVGPGLLAGGSVSFNSAARRSMVSGSGVTVVVT